MANENIKIIVQEVDETLPIGSGSSSDIVYVPGLGDELISAEYKNVPILCSTVEEFETYFGSTPYKFKEEESFSDVKVRPGEYDKSYIYAKELLNAGLSVLYEDISPADNSHVNIGKFTVESGDIVLESSSSNVFHAAGETTAEVSFGFEDLNTAEKRFAGASVIVKSDDCSVEILELKASNTALVEIDSDTSAITWKELTEEEAGSIKVTVKLKISGAGRFGVYLVSGTNISNEVRVTAKRLEVFYTELPERLENLKDKNEYTVKYITSGGYPSFVKIATKNGGYDYSLAAKMLDCASNRSDCVALIDHVDNPDAPLNVYVGDESSNTISFYQAANQYFSTAAHGEFGAMFTPWGDYTCVTMKDPTAATQAMPASFGYLMCLASAIKTSPNWLAMAGVSRGIVPNLKKLRTTKVLSNVVAENYQPKYGSEKNKIAVNAITNVKPYGLTIWGNRTLKPVAAKGTVATNFLNTRNMMSDIKKLAYNTAKSLMFEQDSDALWLNFKSGVSPLLDQLKSGSGISDYKLIRNTTKYNGAALTRGEMAAVIKIFPLYAVEYFEITVVVSDNDVAIS